MNFDHSSATLLGWNLISYSHCQDQCQQASWLLIGHMCKSEQPIRSQVSELTQLLTMTQAHQFPPQDGRDRDQPVLSLEPLENRKNNQGWVGSCFSFRISGWIIRFVKKSVSKKHLYITVFCQRKSLWKVIFQIIFFTICQNLMMDQTCI